MTDKLPDVPALRVLAPPPNGLAVLRTRLDTPPRRWWLLVVPAVVVAAIVMLWLRTRPVAHVPAPAVTALPDHTVGDGFYWVASTPGAKRDAPPPVGVATTVSITDAPQVTYHSP